MSSFLVNIFCTYCSNFSLQPLTKRILVSGSKAERNYVTHEKYIESPELHVQFYF